MKYLVFQIPSPKGLKTRCKIFDNIVLIPGPNIQVPMGSGGIWFKKSFFYVEELDSAESPPQMDLSTLKDFLKFWSFTFIESEGIRTLELETGNHPEYKEDLPMEINEASTDGINPEQVQIRIESHFSIKTYKLKSLYSAYSSSDERLKDLISLYTFEPNRHVSNGWKRVHDEITPLLEWFIIDALVPRDECNFKLECPNGCINMEKERIFGFSHPKTTYKTRLSALLDQFEDVDFYSDLIEAFKKDRGKFVHSGAMLPKPAFRKLPHNPDTGMGHTQATKEETLAERKTEGLSALNAAVLMADITRTLLLNRMIPDLNMWPKFKMMEMTSFTKSNGGIVK